MSHALQVAAAYLQAAVAFQCQVEASLCQRMLLTLDQRRLPRMQPLSSALLSLACLQRLPAPLWQQHHMILEAALPKVSGKCLDTAHVAAIVVQLS